jgi:serine/threonine protein kinase
MNISSCSDSFGSTVNDYIVLELLGKGSQGNVFLVECRNDGKNYALKVIDKSNLKESDKFKRLKSEIVVQKYLSEAKVACDNIIQLKHHFEDDRFVYLMLEF